MQMVFVIHAFGPPFSLQKTDNLHSTPTASTQYNNPLALLYFNNYYNALVLLYPLTASTGYNNALVLLYPLRERQGFP